METQAAITVRAPATPAAAPFSLGGFFSALVSAFRGTPGICSTCHKEFEPDPKHPAYATTCDACAEARLAI